MRTALLLLAPVVLVAASAGAQAPSALAGQWLLQSGVPGLAGELTIGADGRYRIGMVTGMLSPTARPGVYGMNFLGRSLLVLPAAGGEIEVQDAQGRRLAQGRPAAGAPKHVIAPPPAPAQPNPLGVEWAQAGRTATAPAPRPTAPDPQPRPQPGAPAPQPNPLGITWAGGGSAAPAPAPAPVAPTPQPTAPAPQPNPLGITWAGGGTAAAPAPVAPTAPATPVAPGAPPAPTAPGVPPPETPANGNPLGMNWAGSNAPTPPPPPPPLPTLPPQPAAGPGPLGLGGWQVATTPPRIVWQNGRSAGIAACRDTLRPQPPDASKVDPEYVNGWLEGCQIGTSERNSAELMRREREQLEERMREAQRQRELAEQQRRQTERIRVQASSPIFGLFRCEAKAWKPSGDREYQVILRADGSYEILETYIRTAGRLDGEVDGGWFGWDPKELRRIAHIPDPPEVGKFDNRQRIAVAGGNYFARHDNRQDTYKWNNAWRIDENRQVITWTDGPLKALFTRTDIWAVRSWRASGPRSEMIQYFLSGKVDPRLRPGRSNTGTPTEYQCNGWGNGSIMEYAREW